MKLNEKDAVTPARSTDGSAGYGLFSCEYLTILPNEQIIVNLEFSMKIPEGTYGRIAPRSGMMVKNIITLMAGVIDPDYTRDVKVVLYNYGSEPFQITAQQKFTQLVLKKFETVNIDVHNSIRETTRGIDGFGSTGSGPTATQPPITPAMALEDLSKPLENVDCDDGNP